MEIHDVIRHGIEYIVKDIEDAGALDVMENIDTDQIGHYLYGVTIYEAIYYKDSLWLAIVSKSCFTCELIRISAQNDRVMCRKVDFSKLTPLMHNYSDCE